MSTAVCVQGGATPIALTNLLNTFISTSLKHANLPSYGQFLFCTLTKSSFSRLFSMGVFKRQGVLKQSTIHRHSVEQHSADLKNSP